MRRAGPLPKLPEPTKPGVLAVLAVLAGGGVGLCGSFRGKLRKHLGKRRRRK